MAASPQAAAPPPDLLAESWEEAGRRVAASLDACAVAIVVGSDPASAGRVALGIGRAQAERRRVAICDLIGDLAPLQALLPPDALHGLVDHLFCGVSLGKIAHPVDALGNLLVLPSGAGPLDREVVLKEERWGKLVRGFGESGALTLIVVSDASDGLQKLSSVADGAVTAGDVDVKDLSVPILARARSEATSTPDGSSTIPGDIFTPGPTSDAAPPATASAPSPRTRTRATPTILLPVERRPTGGRGLWIAAVLGLLAILGVMLWTRMRDVLRPASSAAPRASITPAPAPVLRDSLAALPVTNPADSAEATAFVVEVMAINSQAAADSQLARHSAQGFPANTYTPLLLGAERARWYRLTTGAFRDSAQADSLMRTLRSRRELGAEAGRVLRAPYTLLIRQDVPPSQVPDLVQSFRARGEPVYALLQEDGSARLFAGSFETPEQASLLASAFTTDSARPSLVYRVGRVF